MTTTTTQTNQPRHNGTGRSQPTHVAKIRNGRGKEATYERIGVAWANEDGSFFVRLHGTQIVSEGFSLYALETKEEAGA